MDINIFAILVAGLASWAVGSLWYSPVLFGKAWQKELGFTDEYLKQGNLAIIFGSSLILMIVMAFGLAPVIASHGDEMVWHHGIFHGAMVGLFFAAAGMGINYLYQRRSFKLFIIDATYQVLFLSLSGLILAIWP